MLHKQTQLLAPTEPDGGTTTVDASPSFAGSPDFLGAFIGNDDDSAAATPAADKKDTPDGTKTDPLAGGNADKLAQPGGDAAGTAAAATPKTDAAAAAKPGDKAPDSPADKEGEDDKWPRSSADWDKFKAKHKTREEKLRGEITTREGRITELQTKLAELEKKAQSDDPGTKAEIEKRDKLIQDLTDRIAILDVTKDPRFEKYFNDRKEAQNKLAENIIGAERKAEWTEILDLPNGQYKVGRMEEFMGALTPYQQSRLGGVLNSLDAIEQERAAEITKANEHRSTLIEERTKKQAAMKEQNAKTFVDTVAAMQDAKTGNPLFQKREGQKEWNAAVDKRIESAKTLLLGEKTTPEQIVKAALYSSAFPDLLASYQADMTEKDAAIAKLTEQVKSLTAAQPRAGSTAQHPSDGSAAPKSHIKEGMNPHEIAEAFARGLTEQANAQ